MSPDDTLPCPASVPPPGGDDEAREERAKAAYKVYLKVLQAEKVFEDPEWDDLFEENRKAWRAAADAAYNHVVVSPNEPPLPPSSPTTSRRP